jgi:hypothetical protein
MQAGIAEISLAIRRAPSNLGSNRFFSVLPQNSVETGPQRP